MNLFDFFLLASGGNVVLSFIFPGQQRRFLFCLAAVPGAALYSELLLVLNVR